MTQPDQDRWVLRFESFGNALSQLNSACDKEEYSELERAGLIQMFEFSFELSWKVMKDLLFLEGIDAKSPREVIRQSFVLGYISQDDSELFLEALVKRNMLSHTYDEKTALEAERLIKGQYCPLLTRVHQYLEGKKHD
jgi:nucleotidyltransferase substrate binding protein (TIGR01987 family)